MSRVALLFTCGLTLVACSSESPTSQGKPSINYAGVFAGENGTEGGSFNVTLVPQDSTGTGTFIVNGATKSLSSLTYNGTDVVASGAGFTFVGVVTDSQVSGTYESGTGGGLFIGLKKIGTGALNTFCGTHIGTNKGVPIAGPFAFVQGNGVRRGVFTSVLSDPFRGVLTSSSAASTVALDTITGAATLAVGSTTFSGSYTTVGGDTGFVAGSACRTTVTSPIGAIFDGLIGGYNGGDVGSLSFNLSSTGLGSTGSYTITPSGAAGPVSKPFLAVISGVNHQVAAFDTTYRVIATLNDTTQQMEGTYTSGGSIAGRFAGLGRGNGAAPLLYCGANTVGGAFSFILRADSTLYGLYSGGSIANAFQGEITGRSGDNGVAFETDPGPVTVLPTGSTFGGFWDHSSTGGTSGTLSGAACP